MSGVVCKYMCGRCSSLYYNETDRRLRVRSGEHIGISPMTFRKAKPSKESGICNNTLSSDEFTILVDGHSKNVLEIRENLIIKCDRPVLNKNISSAKLFLFDNN